MGLWTAQGSRPASWAKRAGQKLEMLATTSVFQAGPPFMLHKWTYGVPFRNNNDLVDQLLGGHLQPG